LSIAANHKSMLFNRILDITCYLSEHKFIENKNGCRPYTVGQPFSYLASLLSLAIERDILVVESLTGRTKLIKFLANIQQDSSGEKKNIGYTSVCCPIFAWNPLRLLEIVTAVPGCFPIWPSTMDLPDKNSPKSGFSTCDSIHLRKIASTHTV
jgi:hypothetical protein